MKLILQITAGVVLGWIIITATKAVLAYTALSQIAGNLPSINLPSIPPKPRATEANPTRPATVEQHATSTEDNGNTYPRQRVELPPSTIAAPYTIRKATPEDAAAKPPQ
jgi:hypothetical protein